MAQVQRPAAVVRPYLVPAGDDNGTGTDETDACDDLGAEPGHIGEEALVEEQILAGHGGHGSADTDEDVGPETGRTALELPLEADERAAEEGQEQAEAHGEERDVPKVVKNRKHGLSPLLKSL